ncbi:MAG: hypothetical protein ACQEVA_18570, partial [Myxococcota bacterium]
MKSTSLRIGFSALLVLAFFNTGATGGGCGDASLNSSFANGSTGGTSTTSDAPNGSSGGTRTASDWPDDYVTDEGSGSAGDQQFGETCDANNACGGGLVCTGGTCVTDGKLRFTLVWEASTDLDIYVKTPSGETIYYRNRHSSDGGVYERDACVNTGCDDHDGAFVETIVWESAEPTNGTYEFWAENYNGEAAADFKFDVRHNGVRELYRGSVGGDRDSKSSTYAITVDDGQTVQQSSGGGGGETSSTDVYDGDEHDSPGMCGHRWHLPPSVQTAGEHQRIDRDAASSTCSGGPTQGAIEFGDRMRNRFGHLMDLGVTGEGIQIYNCRSVRGGTNSSVHGDGRAVDIFIPLDSSEYNSANNAQGDVIANWLVENAERIGIQYIIWDRTQWRGYVSGQRDSCYSDPDKHDHHNHIHV